MADPSCRYDPVAIARGTDTGARDRRDDVSELAPVDMIDQDAFNSWILERRRACGDMGGALPEK